MTRICHLDWRDGRRRFLDRRHGLFDGD